MEKNTKILLGVAAVVVAYLVLKPKKDKKVTANVCEGDFAVQCNDGTCDIGNGVIAPCTYNGGVKTQGTYTGDSGLGRLFTPTPPTPTPSKTCPAGTKEVQSYCIKAPCPSTCMPIASMNQFKHTNLWEQIIEE
jgi:hypothetical protein